MTSTTINGKKKGERSAIATVMKRRLIGGIDWTGALIVNVGWMLLGAVAIWAIWKLMFS